VRERSPRTAGVRAGVDGAMGVEGGRGSGAVMESGIEGWTSRRGEAVVYVSEAETSFGGPAAEFGCTVSTLSEVVGGGVGIFDFESEASLAITGSGNVSGAFANREPLNPPPPLPPCFPRLCPPLSCPRCLVCGFEFLLSWLG